MLSPTGARQFDKTYTEAAPQLYQAGAVGA